MADCRTSCSLLTEEKTALNAGAHTGARRTAFSNWQIYVCAGPPTNDARELDAWELDVRELDHELDARELDVRALDAREVEACVRVLDARALSAQALHGRVLNRVGAR